MSAIWLYVPPIILLAALIGLAIVLGKKTAAMKKIEAQKPKELRSDALAKNSEKGQKLRKIGQSTLRILEALLYYVKVAFRKSEEALARWLKKIKERRTGKKENISAGTGAISTPDLEESDIAYIGEAGELENREDKPKEATPGSLEVTVRRKPEIPPVIMKEEPAPEDKVVEEALIHRIAENPKDMEAYRELGDYYMSIGNIKDAKESFKMVLRLRPRDLKAKTSLKEIELKMRLGGLRSIL